MMKEFFVRFLDFMDFMGQNHVIVGTILVLCLSFIVGLPIATVIVWMMCNFPWVFCGIILTIFAGVFLYCILDYIKNWR